MRPKLSKELHVDRFKDFYWLKEELQVFCREHGISATGSKLEISNRIETFLRTGEILKPVRKSRRKAEGVLSSQLSLETVITENHRCSQAVRAFFKTIIPNFHFSTHIQNYFKTNVGNTYRNVVDAWYEEEERKKDPSYKKEIAPQFEYNRFIRDYYADSKNQGKSREKAIEAWNEVKKRPGSNQYNPS